MTSEPVLHGVAGVTDSTKAFVSMLRMFMRDYAPLNRLIAGEESSDRFLLFAAAMALSTYNGRPPLTNLSMDKIFELNHQDLLLRIALCTVLESVILLQARNHLNYSTGGTSVSVNDKAALLIKILQYYKSTTDQELAQRKIALNILSILGDGPGIHSEYVVVHTSYVFW